MNILSEALSTPRKKAKDLHKGSVAARRWRHM